MKDDLREWLRKAEAIGKLKTIEGADWNLEIGTATALNLTLPDPPALLCDNIKGYPKGYRVLSCTGSCASLVAQTLNLPHTDQDLDLLGVLREKLPHWDADANQNKYPPTMVKSGPILENVLSGDDVDLLHFPVPMWHSLDGGRFIGTGHAVITKDPETGDVNLGTYRLQVLDKKTTGWFMMPNQHGDIHRRKYHEKGERAPIAVSVGHHPILFRVGCVELPIGTEYQYGGSIREEPINVIEEEITGLPIPADSEIVLAGWCPPDVYKTEGPFGEWTGYYGRQGKSLTIEVERIYFRNDPIIVGGPPGRPPSSDGAYFRSILRSALLQTELEQAGIPDVRGVWLTKETNGPYIVVVSIKQRYAGHAKQAAGLVCLFRTLGRQARHVIVVDDDIDPTNISEVLWAVGTRCDPVTDIDIIRDAPSDQLDPRLRRDAEALVNSKCIINACKPYAWKDDFPIPVDLEDEVVKRVKEKWKGLF